MKIEYIDPIDYSKYEHFLEGNIPTKEFSQNVVYSIRTEKLTREEILEKYGNNSTLLPESQRKIQSK